jgi:hypothetical protein
MRPSVILLVGMLGCSGGDLPDTSSYAVDGVAQKGPFVRGGQLTVRALDATLVPTGGRTVLGIEDDLGRFGATVRLTTPFVELVATGNSFDEVSGEVTGPVTLSAITDLSIPGTTNVNALTTLEALRLRHLVSQGATYLAAKEQAQREVLLAFSITEHDIPASERLDVSKAGVGNAMLLAVSAVSLHAAHLGLDEGADAGPAVSTLIAALADDLEADGLLNAAHAALLSRAARQLPLPEVRDTIAERFQHLLFSASIPPFENYVDTDGDGVMNALDSDTAGGFRSAGTLGVPRFGHASVRLSDGRVLVTGGTSAAGVETSAEVWDPGTVAFTATGPMGAARTGHAAVLLPGDGVLVAGGGALPERWDADSGLFTPVTGFPGVAADHARAALAPLADGRILVVTGGAGTVIFDPAGSGSVTTVSSPTTSDREGGVLLPMSDGRVVLAGGATTVEVFSLTDGWIPAATVPLRRSPAAAFLSDGRLLLIGGEDDTGPRADGELVSLSSGNVAPLAEDMGRPRAGHRAALLSDGRILLVGGATTAGASDASAEILDPTSGELFLVPERMTAGRTLPTVEVLSPDTILVLGGASGTPGALTPVPRAEIYD